MKRERKEEVGMSLRELEQMASIKRHLMDVLARKPGKRPLPMPGVQRQKLDEALLAMRAAQRAMEEEGCPLEKGNWLRTVRRAIGVPVKEVARRLGISKGEVLRQERGEQSERIEMSTLRRVAEALECELVYAVVPRVGSLENLAEAERKRAAADEERTQLENRQTEREIDGVLGWRTVLDKAVQGELRKQGIRVQ